MNSKKNSTKNTVGFGPRALGFLTDLFMIGIPITIIIMALFGHNEVTQADTLALLEGSRPEHEPNAYASLTQMALSFIAYVGFWRVSAQTPGMKMARIKVVDAKTLAPASLLQLSVRFVGYFLSFITIIGFFIGFARKDKRPLHDLIARTTVIAA